MNNYYYNQGPTIVRRAESTIINEDSSKTVGEWTAYALGGQALSPGQVEVRHPLGVSLSFEIT